MVMHNSGKDTDTGGNGGGAVRHTDDCEGRYSDGHACSVHRGIVGECACAFHGQKPEPAPARKFVAADD